MYMARGKKSLRTTDLSCGKCVNEFAQHKLPEVKKIMDVTKCLGSKDLTDIKDDDVE